MIFIFNFLNNKKGGSGIGTLIVFIAMVVIAAVGANCLIASNSHVAQIASSIGIDSVSQTSGTLSIQSIGGKQVGGDIDQVVMFVSLDSGSDPVDMSQVIIEINDGTNSTLYTYAGN